MVSQFSGIFLTGIFSFVLFSVEFMICYVRQCDVLQRSWFG